MSLSLSQLEEYKQQGFLNFGDLLNKKELNSLRAAYDEVLCAENKVNVIRDSKNNQGEQEQVVQIRVAHLRHQEFETLLHKTRLLDIVESIIGKEIKLVLFQGLFKPALTGGEIGWHQDDFYFEVNKPNAVVSCWITLDDVNEENGCMWLLPEMHKSLLDHDECAEGGFQINKIDEKMAQPIVLSAGQCLFHHGLAPHKTLKNKSNYQRRALALHFMDATATPLGEGRTDEPAENMPLLRTKKTSCDNNFNEQNHKELINVK